MAVHHRWALAAVAVAGVSVLFVQQTGALWSDSATNEGATLNSGNLTLAVGDGVDQVSDFLFDALAGTDMVGGEVVQKPLYVSNEGTTSLQYRLAQATPSENAPPLSLRVSSVPSESGCPDSEGTVGSPLYDGPISGAVFEAYRPLASGASEVLCFRVTMGEDSEPEQSGDVTFTFEATQAIQP
ncbi:hypothetical protein ACWIE7_17020 [Dietzia sp. NPDC055343]